MFWLSWAPEATDQFPPTWGWWRGEWMVDVIESFQENRGKWPCVLGAVVRLQIERLQIGIQHHFAIVVERTNEDLVVSYGGRPVHAGKHIHESGILHRNYSTCPLLEIKVHNLKAYIAPI